MAPDGPNIQSDDDMDVPLIDVDINDLDAMEARPPFRTLHNPAYITVSTYLQIRLIVPTHPF